MLLTDGPRCLQPPWSGWANGESEMLLGWKDGVQGPFGALAYATATWGGSPDSA